MRKSIFIALCLIIGGSLTLNAQDVANTKDLEKQEKIQKNLEKKQQKELYKAELEVDMHGLRMGAEYSYRTFNTVDVAKGQKHGAHYLIGYRFTKFWYVGGIVGLDVTTPFNIVREGYTESSYNYSVEREDKIYVPVMADVRFYCNVNRVSTYLYTNLGAEFSNSTALICLFGLGFDIHTVKDQCVNLSLGIGLGSWESAAGDLFVDSGTHYDLYDGFVFNFKLGYAF